MNTKEDFVRVRQQIDIERGKSQQEFVARKEDAQREADRKASQKKEREAKFKELGIADLFRMIAAGGMVDRGTISEDSTDWSSSVRMIFGCKPSGLVHDDDYFDMVSAKLERDDFEIEGRYTYKTNLTTRLANGNFLWTKAEGVYGKNYHPEPGQLEASILEVVAKLVVTPKNCGGGYNNY